MNIIDIMAILCCLCTTSICGYYFIHKMVVRYRTKKGLQQAKEAMDNILTSLDTFLNDAFSEVKK